MTMTTTTVEFREAVQLVRRIATGTIRAASWAMMIPAAGAVAGAGMTMMMTTIAVAGLLGPAVVAMAVGLAIQKAIPAPPNRAGTNGGPRVLTGVMTTTMIAVIVPPGAAAAAMAGGSVIPKGTRRQPRKAGAIAGVPRAAMTIVTTVAAAIAAAPGMRITTMTVAVAAGMAVGLAIRRDIPKRPAAAGAIANT